MTLRDAFLGTRYGTARERFRLSPTRGPAPSWGAAGHSWAVVTAWNPGAQAQPEPANEAAHRKLQDRTAHLRCLSAINGEGDWQEDALLLLDLSLPQAVKLGREFGQAAVLFGAGGRAALVWCGLGPVRVERFWAVAHPDAAHSSPCIL